MKKKLFAILLAAVMVTALLPTMAFAAGSQDMTKFVVTIKEPVVGQALDVYPDADIDPNGSIAIEEVAWYKILAEDFNPEGTNEWTLVPEGEVAQNKYLYNAVIKSELSQDYVVAQDASIKLNDVVLAVEEPGAVTGYWVDDSYVFLSDYYMPTVNTKVITKYWVILNTPQVGKTLDFAPQVDFAPQGSITVPTVSWFKILKENYEGAEPDEWSEVAEDEVVKEGYMYAALLEATLSEDGVLAPEEASIKLNDKELTYSEDGGENTYALSDDQGTLYMSEIFEPMSAAEETTTADGNPKTGDNSNMFLWIALIAAGAAAAGVAVANRRKFSGR